MNDFLDDGYEALEISRQELRKVVEKVAALWPATIPCKDKAYGLDSFTCRSIVPLGRTARDNFELVDWGAHEDIAGIALDFVGIAIKHAARYLKSIDLGNMDYDMIIANMCARDDIVITSV